MRRRSTRLALAAVLAAAAPGSAQVPPTPADVLGAGLGDGFTPPEAVSEYLDALARASDRVRRFEYGRTAEGRPLELLTLGSPERLAELDEVLGAISALVDPAFPARRAGEIARANPAVVWFSYGVHGDEAASTEAALWTAWDLASGAGDESGILDSLIVVLDPVANPDGRARYTAWYRSVAASPPDPAPEAREHHPPWPGGRGNHYLFDLNRDWTWGTQAETRARLAAWSRWNPQVHVDFHEMGYERTYFFFPAAEPVHPLYPDYTLRWAEYFGRANAAEFDRRRWLYYTGETFDLYYPGYGDSWPSLVGAIGMTYEQAGGGAAGLAVRRGDGRLLTLGERVEHHRVAGLATLRAAAARKTELLLEFAGFHRSAGTVGPDILLVPGPGEGALRALVAALRGQGIAVQAATRSFRARTRPHPGFPGREEFPAGTVRVPAGQPRGRLALALLLPQGGSGGEDGPSTYDITAWSMPYAYGVEAHSLESPAPELEFEVLPAAEAESPAAEVDGTAYGWLVSPDAAAFGPVYRYLAAGGRVRALARGFRAAGRSWPPGTLFLPGEEGAPDRLREAGLAPLVAPVRSGRTDAGGDLGTDRALTLRPPQLAVVGGDGFSSSGFGELWYFLERVAEVPFRALDAAALGDGVPGDLDVLVLPSGAPGRALGAAGEEALEAWVRDGGTLVAFERSAAWAGERLAGVRPRRSADSLPDATESRRLGLRTRAERRSERLESAVRGVILPVQIDSLHPLAWGLGRGNEAGRTFVLHLADVGFAPEPELETVVAFGPAPQPASGTIGSAKLQEIAESAWLAVAAAGRGRVVLFADDPLFRLFWRTGVQAVAGSLLLGPALR